MSSPPMPDRDQASPTDGPEYRAFNAFAQNTRHSRGFHVNDEAQYRTRRAGPVMNVVVIDGRYNEREKTWEYQLKDANGTPVRLNRPDFEADWIPEKKLT